MVNPPTLREVLIAEVERVTAELVAAEEKLLLQWWEQHPEGGEMVVVSWRHGNDWLLHVAPGRDKESQEAARPSPNARWIRTVAYQVPARH